MSTTAPPRIGARQIAEEVYRPGVEIRVLVDECMEVASEDAIRQAARLGFKYLLPLQNRAEWSEEYQSETPIAEFPRSVRSGHDNASGKVNDFKIFHLSVRDNAGNEYLVGDLTAKVLVTLRNEYAERERQNGTGRKFFDELGGELRRSGKTKVSELDESRVLEIRRKSGYRL